MKGVQSGALQALLCVTATHSSNGWCGISFPLLVKSISPIIFYFVVFLDFTTPRKKSCQCFSLSLLSLMNAPVIYPVLTLAFPPWVGSYGLSWCLYSLSYVCIRWYSVFYHIYVNTMTAIGYLYQTINHLLISGFTQYVSHP